MTQFKERCLHEYLERCNQPIESCLGCPLYAVIHLRVTKEDGYQIAQLEMPVVRPYRLPDKGDNEWDDRMDRLIFGDLRGIGGQI